MSAVSRTLFPDVDPDWVPPLLKAIDEKFKLMLAKVKTVTVLKFQMDWARHLHGDEKKAVMVKSAEMPGLVLFPERKMTTELFEWNFHVPPKDFKFDEMCFRKHILDKAIGLMDKVDCFIVFKLTLVGPNNIGLTERFSIKECPKSHFED